MSEPEHFGNHLQDYVPMPDPAKVEEANIEQAHAEQVAAQMDLPPEPGVGVNQPFEVSYQKSDGSGERYPENSTVTPERAAEDLANWRRGNEDVQRASRDVELSHEIDRLRGEAAQPQPQQPPTEPVALDQQQQEPTPLPPGFESADPDLVRAFRENPKLLESMAAYSWQTDQQIAAAEKQAQARTAQMEAAAADFVAANAKQAIAGVFVRYPELQNLSQQELPLALNLLQRSNPERHAAIMHEIAGIQGLINESNRVARVRQEQATQQYRQQFHTWGGEEDSKFVKAHPEMADNATAANVTQRTRAYVHQKGFSDEDIGRAWSGQAQLSLRDARVQSMLYDAMRYREAVAAVPAARVNKPVKVVTPGPSSQRATEDDYDMRALNTRLNSSHSAKDAAALLSARRMRNR